MVIGSSVQDLSARPECRTSLPAILVCFLLCIAPAANAAWQSPSPGRVSKPAGKKVSPFAAAEMLLTQGHIAEAKEEIQEQLKLNPASVDGYNLLGIANSEEKDYPAAEAAFQQALRLEPASSKSHNNLGNVYVAEGKLEPAAKEFREVLRVHPGDRGANYNLGVVLLAQGAPVAALAHFQRVQPLNVATRVNMVRAYLQAGKMESALKLAHELSAEKKQDAQLHFTLGVLLASAKQYRPAELELEKASALQPQAPEIAYNLGEAYLRTGDYAKAELLLNRALKQKPDSVDILYVLAQVYNDENRPLDALDVLVRAHKIAPQNTDVIFLLARVSMSQNYFEDAIPLLQAGLKIDAERADLRAALGESYFMAGQTEKAIAEFQQLIAVDPSARSFAFMGLAYRHLGRFDEARKYFEQGLRQDPRNASCLFNIGYIEERQGKNAKAEGLFQRALQSNPNFADALLELANLRMQNKNYAEAVALLKRYIRVSHAPAQGYYRLAMAERALHQMQAAERDLNVFQTLSKDSASGPYPYQHLFDYLDSRTKLSAKQRTQLDLSQLIEETKKHPDQPQDLYLLAETYLKLGNREQAQQAIAQLDKLSGSDYRTQTGVGVLLARYRMYPEAIAHFETALNLNPGSDDVKFDLADTYFRNRNYDQALTAAQQVSPAGQRDDAYLSLLGDIYSHLGQTTRATEVFEQAITRNPDNDQYYLSLALVQLRDGNVAGAGRTLNQGLARIPGSGKILWGLGIVAVEEDRTEEAAQRLERAVELMPEWVGSYSTLGFFYFQTGQIGKAREVLSRFKGSNAGGLNINRIEEALSQAPAGSSSAPEPMSPRAREQLLQLALSIADRMP